MLRLEVEQKDRKKERVVENQSLTSKSPCKGALTPGVNAGGRAPHRGVALWQDRLDPLWARISGGCHLNRSPDVLIRQAGLKMDRLETGYIPGPKVTSFLYAGSATN
jgi:hypothetical protein